MNTSPVIGHNRTGIEQSPHAADMEQVPNLTAPTLVHRAAAAELRLGYARDAEPIGTMAPPSGIRSIAKTMWNTLKGENAAALLDKLGERLAFERTGVRLYDGLLAKHNALGTWPGGPTFGELQRIREEELEHAILCKDALDSLGADPTVLTPSADLQAVASSGVIDVVRDPRTNLLQCVEAMQAIELLDNACWGTLARLALAVGETKLVGYFDEPRATEARHLALITGWVETGVGRSAGVNLEASVGA